MVADEQTLKVVGRVLSDRIFRKQLAKDPEGTLAEMNVELDETAKENLLKLNRDVTSGIMGKKIRPGRGGETALHCEVASSVGYA